MTVSYSFEAADSRFSTLYRLLFRWRGSVWQSMWKDLLLWLGIYYAISLVYRFAFPDEQRRNFEKVAIYFRNRYSAIPLTFILGFYVQFVIQRWWNIFQNLGFVDDTALQIATYVRGDTEAARMLRRQCSRYLTLAQALVLRDTSSAVKKRFPTLQHLIDAGLMTEEEYLCFEKVIVGHTKYWVPIEWTCTLLTKALHDKLISDEQLMAKIIDSIMSYRRSLQDIVHYDWISIPLVYTQAVNVAVRAYFMFALIAEQFLDQSQGYTDYQMDFYIPIFTILEFVFYMGWLKVAEVHINPLGEDDDDFETNYILDKNLQTGLAIVDDNCGVIPSVKKDEFWNEPTWNVELPYTEASKNLNNNPMIGSVAQLEVSRRQGEQSRNVSPLMENMEHIRRATLQQNFSMRKTSQFIPTNPKPSAHLSRRRFRTLDEAEISNGGVTDDDGEAANLSGVSSSSGIALFARGIGSRISRMLRQRIGSRKTSREDRNSASSDRVPPASRPNALGLRGDSKVSASKSTPRLRLALNRGLSAESPSARSTESTPSTPTRLFATRTARSKSNVTEAGSRKVSPSSFYDVRPSPQVPVIEVLSPDDLVPGYLWPSRQNSVEDAGEISQQKDQLRKISPSAISTSNLEAVPEDERENDVESIYSKRNSEASQHFIGHL